MAKSKAPSANSYDKPPRTQRSGKVIRRTRTGCLTCRQRRKKCTEEKPTCGGCSRNFLECIWPPEPGLKKGRHTAAKEISLPAPPGPKTRPSIGQPRQGEYKLSRPEKQEKAHTPSSVSPARRKSPSIRSISPTLSPYGRATSLTPCSSLLLQHYLEETCHFLAAKTIKHNPYVTLVVPLASSDDLLMHTVLALSGTQLCFKKARDFDVHLATRRHYSASIQLLSAAIAGKSLCDDFQEALRIALVSLVLCYVEAISGDSHGGIFPHLRACREVILTLLQKPGKSLSHDVRSTTGFVIEVYSFLVLSNSITPYGYGTQRTMPVDWFLTSLDFLREYQTFGILFDCTQGLFELITPVSMFATDRLREEVEGRSPRHSPEGERQAALHDEFIATLERWRSPPVAPEMAQWSMEHVWAGEIYRQALLIFVRVSMCGSVVDDPKVIVAVQRHIDIVQPLLLPVADSLFGTLLLWPVMIIGSCLISEAQRQFFLNRLYHEPKVVVAQVVQAGHVLELLWRDADRRAYGPYGLHLVMEKHGISFALS